MDSSHDKEAHHLAHQNKAHQEPYVSGEEHTAMHQISTRKPKQQIVLQTRWLTMGGAAVVLCALSFWGGIEYQKHHDNTTFITTRQMMGGGFATVRHSGILGQVTAVSATSITVNNVRAGTPSTYTINNSTRITDGGQTVAASDIQVGDTVLISAASGNTTASTIDVNPGFGTGMMGGSSVNPGGPVLLQSN